jgi:hypothetical protein
LRVPRVLRALMDRRVLKVSVVQLDLRA